MAFITCNFFSESLAIHTAINVLLPQPSASLAPRERYPVLWLLHGLSDDQTIWARRTAVERYAEGLPLAVVMPAVNRSFYADMAHGAAYWSYVSEELPSLCRHWFPLSDRREENFVAGLSMGGYGALRLALSHPDRYAAVASLSGAVNFARTAGYSPEHMRDFRLILGEPLQKLGSDLDIFALAERAQASSAPQPQTLLCCGTADFLHDDNVALHSHLDSIGWDHNWLEAEGVDHTWDYWDRMIEEVIGWLPLE